MDPLKKGEWQKREQISTSFLLHFSYIQVGLPTQLPKPLFQCSLKAPSCPKYAFHRVRKYALAYLFQIGGIPIYFFKKFQNVNWQVKIVLQSALCIHRPYTCAFNHRLKIFRKRLNLYKAWIVLFLDFVLLIIHYNNYLNNEII
jgi:hypothetical protein